MWRHIPTIDNYSGTQCHRRKMINCLKLPKHTIELLLLFILYNLCDCISIHPMGKYNVNHKISHISTVQPPYPRTNPPLQVWPSQPLSSRQIQHNSHENGENVYEKTASFSDIFKENNRRSDIQVVYYKNINQKWWILKILFRYLSKIEI